MRSWTRAFMVLGVAAWSSACSRAFEQPEVELESVGIATLGLTSGTLNVNVRIRNPNGFGFRSDSLQYELFLRRPEASGDSAWTRLSAGTFDEEIRIGARRTQTVSIPVDFEYAAVGAAGRSLLRSGSFQYRAVGAVFARTSLGSRRVPFRKTGVFYPNGQNR